MTPTIHHLAISGDPKTVGAAGVFYRTTRPISQARVIEVGPPRERFIPPGSNARTQLALWNERDEEGKLRPHRAIRHGGSHADDLGEKGEPLGNWGDENGDGVDDLGFVCIGETDYRIMLRYSEFDPVGVSRAAGGEVDPASEPYPVGESAIPDGLRAADVPGGCHVYIVQFWTQPLPEFRSAVRAAGGTIYSFLAANAYIMHLPEAASVETVRALACVRWVGSMHPAYRLDGSLLERYFGPEAQPPGAAPMRYNIEVFQRGLSQKEVVAERLRAMRAEVHHFDEHGFRLWATLDAEQLAELVRLDEVSFVDLWGLPEPDMDVAREISGANYVAGIGLDGFRGQAVRGEVMDGNIFDAVGDPPVTHEAFRPLSAGGIGVLRHGNEEGIDRLGHGTATYGIAFGTGAGQSAARGMLYAPDAVGIFATYDRLLQFDGEVSRERHIAELVDENGPYRAVFQSNSWSLTPRTTEYNTDTKEIDDILFRHDLLVCKSQGNEGSQVSGPEAWAKNIVSVGGVKHHDTLFRTDDRYGGCYRAKEPSPLDLLSYRCDLGHFCHKPDCPCDFQCEPEDVTCLRGSPGVASRGPAADGRIKPDLAHFFDAVYTTWHRPGVPGPGVDPNQFYYACDFTGTSCATPIVAGCFGLFFQMWHEGVFPGFGGGTDVFDSRPHMTTAKAMLINTAYRYTWNPGPDDLSRDRQGWGMPDLKELYLARNNMLIIDETDVAATVGQIVTYTVTVTDPVVPLRATMVYADPGGTTSSSIHRINDLSLTLISPGGAIYYGNHGLEAGNWSTPGGALDQLNTVENVLIQSPATGIWTVKVQLDELNADGNPDTPNVVDADYALVVSGVTVTGGSAHGDWDDSSVIDGADFMAFLRDFFDGAADCNEDGATDGVDFFLFLDAFLSGRR